MGMEVSTRAGCPTCSSTSWGQAVHHSGQHAHLVSARALHLAAPVLHATPVVAAAHHQAHLDPTVDAVLHHLAHLADKGKINPSAGKTSQGLPAEFQQDPLILWLFHNYLPGPRDPQACPPSGGPFLGFILL